MFNYDVVRLAFLLTSVIILYIFYKQKGRKKLLNACMKRVLGCFVFVLTFKSFMSVHTFKSIKN